MRTLAALCVAEPLSRDLAAGVGAAVRRLHAEGVWHADLNAHNVLVDRDGRIWIIDFDRARLRPAGSWAAANLARLQQGVWNPWVRKSADALAGLSPAKYGKREQREDLYENLR